MIAIKNIPMLTFNNQPVKDVALFFSSTGLIERTGTFRLYSKEESEKEESNNFLGRQSKSLGKTTELVTAM